MEYINNEGVLYKYIFIVLYKYIKNADSENIQNLHYK